MSYRDISEAVGIRKASIHYHFPNKDDLIVALLEHYGNVVISGLDQIIASQELPEVKLRSFFALFETTLINSNLNKVCLGGMIGAEIESLNQSIIEQVSNFYKTNESQLAAILTEGKKTRDFNFPGDAQTMATLIYSSLQGGMMLTRAKGDITQYILMLEQLVKLVKG